MMSLIAAALTSKQISDVAAYYASFRATGKAPAVGEAPAQCVDCHGADGIALVPDAPNLAGESTIYLDAQLKAFRSGERVHEIMTEIAADLSDDQIRGLAGYFGATRLTIEDR